jgi:hypothetical protein
VKRPYYLYRAVSGASVWGGECSLREARQRVCALRVKWPEAEVERILKLEYSSRRYWRWRKNGWSVHDHYDPTPDDLAKWDYASSIARIAA